MTALPAAHLRIARPTADIDAAIRFWVEGLGMALQGRQPGHHGTLEELAFVGWTHASWHLEIVRDRQVVPTPTEEDLLVLYLDGPVDSDVITRIERAGGSRVAARNPYWDEHGVTFTDADGYLLVLSTRSWT